VTPSPVTPFSAISVQAAWRGLSSPASSLTSPRRSFKILRSDVSSDANFRERFTREADLASAPSRQHIVGVHDRGDYHGQLWIAMEYIDGLDTAHLMEQRYPASMPVEIVTAIVTAVASALDYAHRRGLLHRHVKPANIILAHIEDLSNSESY